ncbi:MAG: glycosyltransferase family 2 protein [Candidatus Omnitrophica bacterium]|nr:glycosyltransferase family 2 protein [Candidatus Omnitrophota bacterium]
MSSCDIIIPVWNQLQYTKRCIESIAKNTRYPYNLILIDNKSAALTRDYLEGFVKESANATLIKNGENLGFIKAANQGLKLSKAPYTLLMNNDTMPTDGWLTKMVAIAESDPMIGLVNPKSESPGGASLEDYSKRLAENKGGYIETNQCMGFCMLIKREVIEGIGYLDEIYGMGGFDDTDFSRRAYLKGYKCVCAKDAYVYHKWHTSFNKAGNREELVRQNEKIFFDKWGRYIRIGYPIIYRTKDDFYRDINISLSMAREWNWVHAWLKKDNALKKALDSMNLPEHQSLRLFNMSGNKRLFYLSVLFRLVERRLKKRKLFDAILVSDKKLLNFLRFFKALFSTPLFYIEREHRLEEFNEKSYRILAGAIAESIKKGKTDEV